MKTRNYFFNAPATELGDKFVRLNKPTEMTMIEFLDSIPFFAEPGDEASTSRRGLVRVYTNDQAIDARNSGTPAKGQQRVLKSSQMPSIGVLNKTGDYSESVQPASTAMPGVYGTPVTGRGIKTAARTFISGDLKRCAYSVELDIDNLTLWAAPLDLSTLFASVYDSTSGEHWKVPMLIQSLQKLLDTDFSAFVAATDNQYIVYDQASGNWIPRTIKYNLTDALDTTIPTPGGGEILTFDIATSKWVALPPAAASFTLAGATDTNISSLANLQSLVYDTATSKWINALLAYALGDLSNVDLSGLADTQVLTYDHASGNWKPATPAVMQVNNPAVNRILTSGAAAGSNLEAEQYLTFVSGVLKISDIGQVVGVLTEAGAGPTTNGIVFGAYGMKSSFTPSVGAHQAGLKAVSTQAHSSLVQGTVLMFESTPHNSNTPQNVMMISESGNVIVKPKSVVHDVSEVDLFVNGSFGAAQGAITTTSYTLDSGTDKDSTIIVWRDAATNCAVDLPEPNAQYDGRIITLKLVTPGVAGTMSITCTAAATSVFYDTSLVSSLSRSVDGEVVRLQCCSGLTSWYWMVMNN